MKAEAEARVAKAERDLRFLDAIDQAANDHAEWSVTVLFYSALAYVDAVCLEWVGAKPANHPERQRQLVRQPFSTDRRFFSRYRRLQDDSQAARYDCAKFKGRHYRALRENEYGAIREISRRWLKL